MSTPLARKLQIKPGMRLAILHPPDGFLDALAPLPEGTRLVAEGEAPVEYLHLFARSVEEVRAHLAGMLDRLVYDGLLWVSWPKRSSGIDSDLTRDGLAVLFIERGYQGVASVSIDEVWSALRFRPAERVGR